MALHRGYSDEFRRFTNGEDIDDNNMEFMNNGKRFKIKRSLSAPGSPSATRLRSNSIITSTVYMTPGDLGTLQEANNADDHFVLSNDQDF